MVPAEAHASVLDTRAWTKSCQLTLALVHRCCRQVVRVQYHPGAHKASGGWLVEPELKMELIGRMGTEEKEKGAVEAESANDGSAQKDATETG